ncbi:MAG: hypothetical protein KIT84_06240 [Labilithrix sp.]|nr:hypothetical protein [Labilithrix sp.]MCW5810591.1 hypothetical protein [Labilithrix sp.]
MPLKKPGGPQIVSGSLVAALGERSLGPYLAKRGSGEKSAGLVAWLTAAEGQGRRVIVVPVDGASGQPRGGETTVAYVPVDTMTLTVRPMRGPAPGFIVAWTALTDRGKSLWSIAVGDNGAARGKPVEITRSNDDISWVDVVPTDRGAVMLWAEETRGGDANLTAASLDTDGKVRESAVRVARSVVGWHATELPGGLGLSTIAAAPLDPKAQKTLMTGTPRSGGALSFTRLDAEGHAFATPVAITSAPVVSGDVEVVRDGSRVVFAWTDRSTEEPAVAVATIDDKNLIEGPRRVAEARGGAALLGLTSGPAGVAVMFEAPARRKDENRRVHVARIGDRLYLDRPALTIDTIGKTSPELSATASGFAVLATAADCEADSPACPNAPAVATVFRTDAKVGLVQREPLTFQTDPAALGWNFSCEGEQCLALAASGSAPARIRVVAVKARENTKPRAPVVASTATAFARIDDVTAVASGESVLHLAAARAGYGVVVATLGAKERHLDRGADKEPSATVTARVVDEQGHPGRVEVVAPKALPNGGVGVAFADKPDDGGALVWVGRDGGDSQVHVTRIDRRGRRQADSLLTSAKGEKTDVTVTWAGNGYVVAWVDTRSGNGEVYATKLQPDLTRVAREERITDAPGDASDLVALARGEHVWLAWADPRESPSEGLADIYVTAVKKLDAKRVFDEQRMLATAAHSRTPRIVDTPDGPAVAWIEEAPAGSESPNGGGFGAFWIRLDDTAKPLARPARIPLAGEGAATAVAIEGGANARAVVARSMIDAIALDGVDLTTSPPRAAALLALDGPPSLDVSLLFVNGVLYFNDEGPTAPDRRARRARITWR